MKGRDPVTPSANESTGVESDEVGRRARAKGAGRPTVRPGNDRSLRCFAGTLRMKDDGRVRATDRRQERREGKAFRANLAGGAPAREIRLGSQMRIAVRQRADLRKEQRERERCEGGNSAAGSGQGVFVFYSCGGAYARPLPDSSQNGRLAVSRDVGTTEAPAS